MRKDITAIADQFIPSVTSIQRKQDQFITDDIINEVLLKFTETRDQVKQFAHYLKGETVRQTCYNVWHFWRSNIRYVPDDARRGKQIIKSPAAVWADKFCDCKSFSVAVNSCLYHLGIDSVFRFVSFNPGTKTLPTHVYNVAKYQGGEIIIDCCLPQFDMEKRYAAKYDYLQPGLYSVTGVGRGGFFRKLLPTADLATRFIKFRKRKRGELKLDNVKTEAELGLVIHEQRVELEQNLAAKIHGIGSTIDKAYEIELAAINNAIYEIGNSELKAERCRVCIKPAENYIGKPLDRDHPVEIGKKNKEAKKEKKPQPKKAKKEEKKVLAAKKKNEAGKGINKKDAKRLEKLNITVKKKKEGLLKKVAKVITAPVRLVQKGIIQATLPKSAPAFLYLFLSPQVLAKAPEIVKSKYNKAKQYADRVVNKIGMKQDHFMGILRNGIMQNMGDTPENILSGWMRDAGFRIGIISEIFEAGKALGQLLGGKAAALMNDAPAPEDWGTMAADVKEQVITQQDTTAQQTDPTQGNGVVPVKTEDQMYQQATTNTGYNYSTTPIPTGDNTGYGNYSATNNNPLVKKESENNEAATNDEDTSEASKDKPTDKPESSGGNTGLIIAAAAVVLLAAGGRKKKRA